MKGAVKCRFNSHTYIYSASGSRDCEKDVSVVEEGLRAAGFIWNDSLQLFEKNDVEDSYLVKNLMSRD